MCVLDSHWGIGNNFTKLALTEKTKPQRLHGAGRSRRIKSAGDIRCLRIFIAKKLEANASQENV